MVCFFRNSDEGPFMKGCPKKQKSYSSCLKYFSTADMQAENLLREWKNRKRTRVMSLEVSFRISDAYPLHEPSFSVLPLTVQGIVRARLVPAALCFDLAVCSEDFPYRTGKRFQLLGVQTAKLSLSGKPDVRHG